VKINIDEDTDYFEEKLRTIKRN